MATSHSTDLAAMPGIRLAKISRPIDRQRESRWLPLSLTHRLLRPDYVSVCYHNICTAIDPLTHFGYDTKTALEFEHDLGLLAETFGIADASGFAHSAAPTPGVRGQALVTFDDGHRQWLDEDAIHHIVTSDG